MASNNNSLAQQSRGTSDDKVDQILKTLPDLIKPCHHVKEDLSGRSEEKQEITETDTQKEIISRSQSAPPDMTHDSLDVKLIERLQYHFRILKLKLGRLELFRTSLGTELDEHLVTVQGLIAMDSSKTSEINSTLDDIEKRISDLLYQVPLLPGKHENQKATAYGDQDDEDKGKAYGYLPGIYRSAKDLTKCEVFRQVKQKFLELGTKQKICLLSFAVFPENREVHRTTLMYWWIGEGIFPVKGAEETVKEVLKELTDKKLVEPVEERRKVAPSSYKMNPFVHSSVIHLSEEIGLFNFYREKEPTVTPTMNNSPLGKVCLVEGSFSQPEGNPKKMPDRERIETVFNVSERFPDFALKLFSKHKSLTEKFSLTSPTWRCLRVFYLGRWERSKNRRIEIQNPQLMQYLKYMTKLRLLSFQGISGIRILNSSVCTLNELMILDLRECYDLQKLPEKINSLQKLIYLDMTGCYNLEWIPIRLALLKNLEVLKGFVVSDHEYDGVACRLDHLKCLTKLRKLSIEINRYDLGVEQLMKDIGDLKALRSLKVTWRRDLRIIPEEKKLKREYIRIMTRINDAPTSQQPKISILNQLTKLDVQCYPHEDLPPWLRPDNLQMLETLHIGRARRLKGFGILPEMPTKCAVKVLRLTSLPKLKVGWIELKELYFPKLTFLENRKCPRVTLTPCDGNGIWRSDED